MISIDTYGGKAAGLARLDAVGARTPNTAVLGFAELRAHTADTFAYYWREELRGLGPRLAVRSSFTDEDLPWLANAGQHETLLGVRNDADAVFAAAAAVCGDDPCAQGSVVFQTHLAFRASGVAFSADPAMAGVCLIEWADESEGVTSGGESRVGRARFLRTADPALDSVPAEFAAAFQELAALLCRCHDDTENGVDIEWGIGVDGLLYLLQLRPITTATPHLTGRRAMIDEGHELVGAVDALGQRKYGVVGEVDDDSLSGRLPTDLQRQLQDVPPTEATVEFTVVANRLTWQESDPGAPALATRVICFGSAAGRAVVAAPSDTVAELVRRAGEAATSKGGVILVTESPQLELRETIEAFDGFVFRGGAALGHFSIILREHERPSLIEPLLEIVEGDWVRIVDGQAFVEDDVV